MIYPIVPYGDPILRRKADSVPEFYADLKQVVENMFETMENAAGVGLAAPQIDLSLRLFVIDANPFADEDIKAKGFRKVFVNPEIIEEWGEPWAFNEGCLSFPGVHEDVYRKANIKIKYQDEDFKIYEEEYDGYLARVIQHEYDHVEGKVFIDHLGTIRRTLLKKRLDNISKGETKADYRMKSSISKRKRI